MVHLKNYSQYTSSVTYVMTDDMSYSGNAMSGYIMSNNTFLSVYCYELIKGRYYISISR